jgi:putative ABC transporter-associated repeat protein
MRVAAGTSSLPIAVALAFATPGVANADAVVLGEGHVDYGARMVAGQLRSQIKDGTQGADRVVWREPADVLFEIRPAAKLSVPSDARLRFLGPSGSSVWMIPQVQQAGILWAGWNTEELTSADVHGAVTWTLQAVQGPGTVAVFQTGAFGDPDVIFNSADGLPDSRAVPLGVHAHANWTFSAPGRYALTFQMTATRAGGGALSDTQTLAVQVDAPAAGGSDPPAGDPGQPPAESTPPAGDAPNPQPDSPRSDGGDTPTPLTLSVSHARVRGRMLTFRAQLSQKSRLDVTVRRAGRVVTRAKARSVAATIRSRTLTVRLGRTLSPGRTYKATIRVRTGGATATRTLTVRAR